MHQPVTTWQPPQHVSLHFVGEEGVLFDAASQRLYAVNTTAAFIWCCLEDRLAAPVIAERLQSTFKLDPSAAHTYVTEIVGRWSQLGLFASSKVDLPATSSELRLPERPSPGRAAEWRALASWNIRLLDCEFRLRIMAPVALTRLRPVLEPLGSQLPSTDATHSFDIDVVREHGVLSLRCGGQVLAECANASLLAPTVKVTLLRLALEHCEDYGAIHGAAIGRGDRCILFPGASGAGKSTLSAALVSAGYRLLGDDTIVLSYGELAARPVPFGICLKQGSVKLLSERFADLGKLPVHDRLDGKRVRYLVPPARQRATANARFRIGAIVVLNRQERGAAVRRPLGKADTLRRLMDGFCPLRGSLDRPEIERLVRWIDAVPCFELHYSDLDGAVAQVREIFA
jgi:hypothetical protein